MTQDANEAVRIAEPIARLNARIPEDLHTRLSVAAAAKKTTIQALLIRFLIDGLDQQ